MTDVETPTNPEDPLVGSTIGGKYRVVRLCGRGGMGSVYEAQNIAIGKKVALKFIDPASAGSPDAVHRFLREAQAASAAESLHIVQVFDVGETPDGRPYMVMELLRGENLAQRLGRLGRLPISEAVHIAVHTLRGLRRAHEVGIVHRDLKPENIFLVETDDDPIFVKVVDFGVSKILKHASSDLEVGTLTRQGVVLGTPYYMAPEQAQGMPDLDARTDLWAVGAILWECLTGERPHKGKTYEQVIVAICTKDVPDVRTIVPSVPVRIADVIKRAMTRDREQRVQTANEFIDSLRDAAPELVSSNPSFDPALDATLLSPQTPLHPIKAPQTPLHPVPSPREVDAGAAANTRSSWSSSESGKSPLVSVPQQGWKAHWRVALLGATMMLAAFALTLGMMRRNHEQRESGRGMVASAPTASQTVPASVELHVVPTPSAASVFANDRLMPEGILKGPAGSSIKLRVEAEGYKPVERTVVLDGSAHHLAVELEAVADAAPVADPRKTKPSGAIAKASDAGTSPQPKSSGIAGELKLKTDGP
ncbi:MAG: serine/threonine protein kinase [Deltaproteobacteria bacterium]|nr:serine/threonine protein kinase [Deltaproteobacteria bacterium]